MILIKIFSLRNNKYKNYMEKFISSIDSGIKAMVPFLMPLSLILNFTCLIYIIGLKDDIKAVSNEVSNLSADISNISVDYDNSDIIHMINNHHRSISNQIQRAENNLSGQIIIYGN